VGCLLPGLRDQVDVLSAVYELIQLPKPLIPWLPTLVQPHDSHDVRSACSNPGHEPVGLAVVFRLGPFHRVGDLLGRPAGCVLYQAVRKKVESAALLLHDIIYGKLQVGSGILNTQ